VVRLPNDRQLSRELGNGGSSRRQRTRGAYDLGVGEIEYPGVYVDEVPSGAKAIAGVPTSTVAFVGPAPAGPSETAVTIQSLVEFERTFGPTEEADPTRLALQLYFTNGGTSAIVVRSVGPLATDGPASGAMHALDDAHPVNLLCLPGLWRDASVPTLSRVASDLAAASQLSARRGAIVLVDPSPAWSSVSDVVSGPWGVEAMTADVERGYAAVLFPGLLVDTNSGPTVCGPSGAIAGVIARTDATRGVWHASAGIEATISGSLGPSIAVSDAEAAMLAQAGINAIRTFPTAGVVMWGGRLLAAATAAEPEWKYVNVRRLSIFLEHSIEQGLRWAVFEPNDEPLWASVRQSVGTFLLGLFRQGAFAGFAPQEAYFVRCGRDTMTQDEIDGGVLNVLIGFAPMRPFEFVIVRIGLDRPEG
jgi:phage tail sheath protein FI